MILTNPPGPRVFQMEFYLKPMDDGFAFEIAFLIHDHNIGPAAIGAAVIHAGNQIIGMAVDADEARQTAMRVLSEQEG